MLRKDYKKHYKKLNLKKSQINDLGDFIENNMFILTRDCMESEGWTDAFNDLYWYFSGDADCKDMFSEECKNPISIQNATQTEIKSNDYTLIKKFVDFIKITLTEEQFKILKQSINELYVRDKEFIENNWYLNVDYRRGKLTAQFYFLEVLK